MKRKIILASGSPRRKKLLKQIGLQFSVQVSNIDETNYKNLPVRDFVKDLSLQKAQEILKKHPDALIIAADTMIVANGEMIGKPTSKKDAARILAKLNNSSHSIITGVTVLTAKKSLTRHEESKVYFRMLTQKEIDAYVATGEPMDKAGAYGIQEKGAMLVRKIEGDYFNVVGLPIALLLDMLKEFGIEIL